MSTNDLGESLVGAYMRHIEKCSIVLYNSYFADQQGENASTTNEPAYRMLQMLTHLRGEKPSL
jgi:hypothetical protein